MSTPTSTNNGTATGDAQELPDAYRELTGELREIAALASATALLGWDQETMMPLDGAALRAEQLALLSGIVHDRRTHPKLGDWISACEADATLTSADRTAANLREIRRDYDRATRLPTSLVRELAHTTSQAMEVWKDARERSDFAAFAPWLTWVIELTRAKAWCYGAATRDEVYDALLDEYEPGTRTDEIARVFADLRGRLSSVLEAIAASEARPGPALAGLRVPIPRQQAFNRWLAEQIGFDLSAGRLDTSAHPFCEGVGPGDTRLTTRYREDGFLDALSSTLHEAGHGMYEQGLPKTEFWGQPLAESASLGMHESQSRLWENMVGRSRPFWEWALPAAQQTVGAGLTDLSVEDVFGAANAVEPSLIRVESDEATYNLHIMLRFDFERALLADDLRVDELPAAWSDRIRQDLGLEVPDDRRGCLQDVHWSAGLLGYFPTYTLGNLYAAQLWEAIRRDMPEVETGMAKGDFDPILGWLREHIHRHGRRYPAAGLCRRATGAPLSAEPLLRYLDERLRRIYSL